MLRLRDTATGHVTELSPRDRGSIGLYVCGPTVYGSPHVGHGRFALVYDILRRYLEFSGLRVDFVSNITDIDDKIIDRAAAEGRSWSEVAGAAEAEWWEAMDAMGVRRPSVVPHATDFIEGMVDLVGDLIASGRAYETGVGVYLDAASVSDYGLLKHQSIESLRAGARVEIDEQKRSPIDFALWKAAKPGEPTWDAPFGAGRPGWHTECVVMSLALLGEGFDLHGGGEDLIFPHHENERAQAEALGRPFARHWMHNGLVRVSGEKMSKSLGNTMTLRTLLERHDARAYRMLVLGSHYRQPIEVTERSLDDASLSLQRVDALARRFAGAPVDRSLALAGELRERFTRALDDDLDTASALGELFTSLRRANALGDEGDAAGGAALAGAVLALLSVLGIDPAIENPDLDAQVAALVAQRDAARAARDFVSSDRLRSAIEALGWVVEDTAEGTHVHR